MTLQTIARPHVAYLLALFVSACGSPGDKADERMLPAGTDRGYVGAATCERCHTEQARLWRESDHDLAMQPATEAFVIGDFQGATFEHNGVESSFYRRDGEYFTRTDGPDGAMAEFPVRYTFGIHPLQQYIVELPNGHLQALGVAWDSRDEAQGGQRWFHVYGDDRIDHDDVLHWTRMSQSWDSMCADCHSTGLTSQYDIVTDQFDTHWAEINVACEACHGPGLDHVAWAESEDESAGDGLQIHLDERRGVEWVTNPGTGNSKRSRPHTTKVEIDVCAPCHSRRSKIAADPVPGAEFLDAYLPALPEPPLYHADGQILDEVYVYGSFLQSRMYQNGVTCSDCHEPHSLQLRAPGSRVCLQCHLDERFATAEHQLLPDDTDDVVCVECHMPKRTYMQVDERRDHSFRVPRPDLSVAYGTPNACNDCHADESAEWAVNALADLDRAPRTAGHWVENLLAADASPVNARAELLRLATNSLAPGIIRATAIAGLPMGGDAATVEIVAERAQSSDPMIRWAVARSLQRSHPAVIASVGPQMLNDPVLAVRMEAVSALSQLDLEFLPPESMPDLQRGIDEYVAAQLVSAERPGAHINIGNIRLGQRRFSDAEASYRTAIRLNPQFVPAYVNLADLYRALGRDAEGQQLLQSALQRIPADRQSALHHSLGLTLVRLGQMPAAIGELGMAANGPDADPQYVLAYALALDAQGESHAAAGALEGAIQRFGEYPQLLAALVNVYQRMGDMEAASALAARMQLRDR